MEHFATEFMTAVRSWIDALQAIGHKFLTLEPSNVLSVIRLPGISLLFEYTSFLLIGLLILFVGSFRKRERFSLHRAWRTLFPNEAYRHNSSRVDYWFSLVEIVAVMLGTTTLLVLTTGQVSTRLVDVLGPSPFSLTGSLSVAVQALTLAVAVDFAFFMQHYLFHKVPVLWRLHRVHHSAEVLTPLTGIVRGHPLENTVVGVFMGVGGGLIGGFIFYACGVSLTPAGATVAATVSILFLTIRPFRHSHIWVPFPRSVSYVFNSPCMHQIHHSALPQHRDKNMAFMLSLWDWIFGTLYIPRREEKETLVLGISFEEVGRANPHRGLDALIEPALSKETKLRWRGRARGIAAE